MSFGTGRGLSSTGCCHSNDLLRAVSCRGLVWISHRPAGKRSLPVVRCRIPRLSIVCSSTVKRDPEAPCSSDRAQSRVEVRGIPHLPKPGRYPYFLYAVPKSATCAAFIKESRMDFLEAKQLHRKYGLWGTHHSLPVE